MVSDKLGGGSLDVLQITITTHTETSLSHGKKIPPVQLSPREAYLLIIFRKLKHALYQVQVFLKLCASLQISSEQIYYEL